MQVKGDCISRIGKYDPIGCFQYHKILWEKGLGRLVNPLPNLNEALADLQAGLGFLQQ